MRVSRQHSLGQAEARKRVEQIADEMAGDLNLRTEWRDHSMQIRGSGVTGQIDIMEHSIEVTVNLGFTMMLLDGAIRLAIEDKMDKYLS